MPILSLFPASGENADPYAEWFGTGEDGDLTVSSDTELVTALDQGQIIKQYRNLTVNEGYTLRPSNRCNGMILLVSGDLNVYGTISVDKCAPLVNTAETTAAQETHVALFGSNVGGNGGDPGLYSDADSMTGDGNGGAGFALGGGYGGGASSCRKGGGDTITMRQGGDGNRPPMGTSMPYPASIGGNSSYGAGGSVQYYSQSAAGGGGPGGSGAFGIYAGGRFTGIQGNDGDAYGGGLLCIFVRGKVRIHGTGKITALGGTGGNAVSGTASGVGYGGCPGGGGGGGLIYIAHTGDYINSGAISVNGGAGGTGGTGGGAGEIGCLIIKNIKELLNPEV